MPSATSNTSKLPPVYVVGTQHLSRPLVSAEHVKGHLRLLRAFYNLRIIVEDCKDRRIPEYAKQMNKETRWRWFVHLAVERFERWVGSLQFVPLEKFVQNHIPPVDVWMVWHAYLLSPCWYAEDCERLTILQQLRLLNMFVVGSINIGKAVKRKPSNQRMETWYKQTGMYFNPFEAMASTDSTDSTVKRLECPRCRTSLYAPFIDDAGTGFAEAKFSFTCPLPGCKLQVTHNNLAVAKFVRDLSEEDGTGEHAVSGSFFNPSGKRDAGHAKVINDQLMNSPYFAGLRPSALDERLDRLDRVKEVKEKIGYSLNGLKEAISTSLRNCPAAWVTRILGAYSSGSPFSIDLVDAVQRQCQFTTQLEKLGWLTPGAFRTADKLEILHHSVMRYHAFLDLTAVHQGSMFVPSLDIDLVWHTHQLMASRYSIDCEMYVGRNVDHEVSVAESHLSSAFDDTCRAWKARFQVPYIQCGCPIPDETPMHKLVRLVRHYIRGRSQFQIDLHPEHFPVTHPSTHNAFLTSQTVSSGAFGKFCHSHGKQKEEKLRRSPSLPHFEQTLRFSLKRSTSTLTQSKPDWLPSMPSPAVPVYFEKGLSLVADSPRL